MHQVSNSIYCLYFEFILQQKRVFHQGISHFSKRSIDINRNNKKKEWTGKKEAGRDGELIFFFTWPITNFIIFIIILKLTL